MSPTITQPERPKSRFADVGFDTAEDDMINMMLNKRRLGLPITPSTPEQQVQRKYASAKAINLKEMFDAVN